MPYFGYDTCIACPRHWCQEDKRKGHEWWRLRDGEVTRWLCYRCISRAWRKSGAAARIGPCTPKVEEALQTDEFQSEIHYLLKKHICDYALEPMDVDG